MGSQFKRLKRYNVTWSTLRALALAAAVALLAAGGLLVVQKLRIMEVQMLHYGIGIAAGVVLGLVSFLLMRRKDLRLAEVIDKEHGLRERVQTMVAYQNEDSAMLQVQREDTENRLRKVKHAGVRAYSVVAHILLLAVAVAVFMTGMSMPTKAVVVPTQPTEPPYVASEWQRATLEELIVHVQEAPINEVAKESMVTRLQALRDALDTRITYSAIKNMAISVMVDAYEVTDRVNSNDDVYKNINAVMQHSLKDSLAYVMGTLNNAEFDEHMSKIESGLREVQNLSALGSVATDIRGVVSWTTEFDDTDPLYAALALFADELEVAGEYFTNKDMVGTQNQVGVAVYNLRNNAAMALQLQSATKEECVYVVDTLCVIFAISDSERPQDPDQEHTVETQKPPPELEGSPGSGEMQYASDDEVYDPDQNTHVHYGELIHDYYAEMLQDARDGKYSDDLADFLMKYFGDLYISEEDRVPEPETGDTP